MRADIAERRHFPPAGEPCGSIKRLQAPRAKLPHRSHPQRTPRPAPLARFARAAGLSLLALAGACQPPADPSGELVREAVPVLITPQAGPVTRGAAELLAQRLRALYPALDFPIAQSASTRQRAILLQTNRALLDNWGFALPPERIAGSFLVTRAATDGGGIGAIYGADEASLLNGVHALLARLGHGAYLSIHFEPPPAAQPFDFSAWQLADATPFRRRVAVSGQQLAGGPEWSLSAWRQWIAQLAALRFNTLMLHWDARHPALAGLQDDAPGSALPGAFAAGGRAGGDTGEVYAAYAPDAAAASTDTVGGARGWPARRHAAWRRYAALRWQDSTQAITTDGWPARGAGHARAVRELAAAVIDHARGFGIAVNLSLDLDGEALHPPAGVEKLPAEARWCAAGVCIANPDTADGHAFYRERLRALLARWPQVSQLTVWLGRAGPAAWLSLGADELPAAWRQAGPPMPAGDGQHVAQRIASRITASLLKALAEIQRADVALGLGGDGYDWMDIADALHAPPITFAALDRTVRDGHAGFVVPKHMVRLRALALERDIVPILLPPVDGAMAGRPHAPVPDLQDRLLALGIDGVGVAPSGWPQDIWLANVSAQLWLQTRSERYEDTAAHLAGAIAPGASSPTVAAFLRDWARSAPVAGSDARDAWQRTDALSEASEHMAVQRDRRAALLAAVDSAALHPAGAEYLRMLAALDRAWTGYAALRHDWLTAQAHRAVGELRQSRQAVSAARPDSVLRALVRFAPGHRRAPGRWGDAIALPAWLPALARERWRLGDDAWRQHFGPSTMADGEPAAADASRIRYFIDAEGRWWHQAGRPETGAVTWRLDGPPPSARGPVVACERGILLDQPLSVTLGEAGEALAPGRYRLRALFTELIASSADETVSALTVRANPQQEVVVHAEIDVFAQTGAARRALAKQYTVTVNESAPVTLTAAPMRGRPALCGLSVERIDNAAAAQLAVARPIAGILAVSNRDGRIYHAPHGMRYGELDDYLQLPAGAHWLLPNGVAAADAISDGALVTAVAAHGERRPYRFVLAAALSTGRTVRASREQRTPIWGIPSALATHAVDGNAELASDAQGADGPFWATMEPDSPPGWLEIDLGSEYYIASLHIAWLAPAINPNGAAKYQVALSDDAQTAWRVAVDRSDNQVSHRTVDRIDRLARALRVHVLDSSYVLHGLAGIGDYKLIGATEITVHGGLLYSDNAQVRVDYPGRSIAVSARPAAALKAQLRAVNAGYALAVWRGQEPLPDDALLADGDSVLVTENARPGRRERYRVTLPDEPSRPAGMR